MGLLFLFGLSASATIWIQSFYPLNFLFAFLALLSLRLDKARAFWMGALSGLFLDLLCTEMAFGLHAFIFVVTMSILFPYRRFFFEEKWLPFTFLAFLFSCLSSFFIALATTLMQKNLHWSPTFIVCDLIVFPILDAIGGYLLLIVPKLIVRFFKRTLIHWRLRNS